MSSEKIFHAGINLHYPQLEEQPPSKRRPPHKRDPLMGGFISIYALFVSPSLFPPKIPAARHKMRLSHSSANGSRYQDHLINQKHLNPLLRWYQTQHYKQHYMHEYHSSHCYKFLYQPHFLNQLHQLKFILFISNAILYVRY